MPNEIRLAVNAYTGNHSFESPTIINNDVLAKDENKELLNDLHEVEIKEQSGRTRNLANEEKQRTKIQRFPEIMLQYKHLNEFHYKPREVSIGPIHAECDNLSKRELKIRLAVRFIKRSGKTGEELLGKIKDNVGLLRKCFDKRVIKNYDDDKLSRLLFLDGCFLRQFVEIYFFDSLKDFNITNGVASVMSNDLLLAENQIPFSVFKLLMDSCSDKFQNTLIDAVLLFVATNVPIGYPYDSDYLQEISIWLGYEFKSEGFLKDIWNLQNWVHLLDIRGALQISSIENKYENQRDPLSYLYKFQTQKPGCFSLCLSRIKRVFGQTKTYRDGERYRSRSFRNVQELKLAGIKLRPSGSDSLKDISFSTKYFISAVTTLRT